MQRLSVLIGDRTRRALRHMKCCLGRTHTESVRKGAELLDAVGDDALVIVRPDGTWSVYYIE